MVSESVLEPSAWLVAVIVASPLEFTIVTVTCLLAVPLGVTVAIVLSEVVQLILSSGLPVTATTALKERASP